ncbi:MAG: pantoate--beta-alanine ligase [Chloracidobacterium sp.]|nr:pantoate--beta-alanine ligase [Chloracidobacterium sp.]MDW8216582.1 pantoate--beta-alanine ligase [Acidobacteriota bacterium]
MEIVTRIPRMRMLAPRLKRDGKKLALIPTMSALHEGHASLIRRAQIIADVVVVSIFFNPIHFQSGDEFEVPTRDLARDAELVANKGVDVLFAPSVDEIYPEDFLTYVTTDVLDCRLCGAKQPNYFRGVTTIINKLINIVQPHFTLVGQKDAQQSIIIRRMVRDLSMDTEVVICPTVRGPDGLVISSRNAMLNPAERRAAPVLYRSLQQAQALVEREGVRDAATLLDAVRQVLATEPLVRPEYVALVDLDNLNPLPAVPDDADCLLALAAYVGHVRLTDNIILSGGAE